MSIRQAHSATTHEAHDIAIIGWQKAEEVDPQVAELRRRFVGQYLAALLSADPELMASTFSNDFWPHDLCPGDQPPVAGLGRNRMINFRDAMATALIEESTRGYWLDAQTLTRLTGIENPTANSVVGARLLISYWHNQGTLRLPIIPDGQPSTGKLLTVLVDDAARFSSEGQVVERWALADRGVFLAQLLGNAAMREQEDFNV